MTLLEQLENLRTEVLASIAKAHDSAALEEARVRYLGRKGALAELLSRLRTLPDAERPTVGKRANEVKDALLSAFSEREKELDAATSVEAVDPTWPGQLPPIGHLHPITQFLRRVEAVFVAMGFEVVEGSEVETERYNFDLLNIPADHPSRDLWDTFYVESPAGGKRRPPTAGSRLLLRTHTSPMQLRVMEKRKPPVRIIVPGRVFRHEATDASHESTFTQCEGLVIDRGVRVTDLIGTLDAFLKAVFGVDVRTRVRPHYYPFVEPGMDIDMSCLVCGGRGCSVCGGDGWLEMLGSGMVHPHVLKNMRVDPNVFSGFAFGLGIDRMVMLYHGIDDIRLFYSGNVRFLEQF
jgi:phenylalanyl-tRNA synthetase alpha chain